MSPVLILFFNIHRAVNSCVMHTLSNLGAQAEGVQYHPPNAPWPNPDIMKTMPFDYTIHDPKYDDISSVYSPGYKSSVEGRRTQKNTHTSQYIITQPHLYSQNTHLL